MVVHPHDSHLAVYNHSSKHGFARKADSDSEEGICNISGYDAAICLLTTIYKLYAILVFQKVRDRVKEFVSWTQAGFIKQA